MKKEIYYLSCVKVVLEKKKKIIKKEFKFQKFL